MQSPLLKNKISDELYLKYGTINNNNNNNKHTRQWQAEIKT